MSIPSEATSGGTTTTGSSLTLGDDSQFARKIIERKLASVDEIELVREEVRDKAEKGEPTTLADLLVRSGYITQSQLDRLNLAMDEDSMYRPAQQIPGYQILGKLGQGMATVLGPDDQASASVLAGAFRRLRPRNSGWIFSGPILAVDRPSLIRAG